MCSCLPPRSSAVTPVRQSSRMLYNILELCRTGVTALERGGKHEHMQKLAQEVGEAQLPLPGTHCH